MLSKSDFKKHIDCPILLWMQKMRKDLLPVETPKLQRRFEMGDEIDRLSRQLYPEGIEVEGYFSEGFANTKALIKSGAKVLLQPTAITVDGLMSQADFLIFDDVSGTWEMREVKSSTSVKEEHLIDVAFQKICFDRAGIKIGKTFLICVNNEYVRDGDVEVEKLFKATDITEEVAEHTYEVKKQIEEAKNVLKHQTAPDLLLIQKCHDPEKCDFLPYYIHGFPEIYEMLDSFPRQHLKALLDKGVLDYEKVPQKILDEIGFKPQQFFEKINSVAIQNELSGLKYPLYFLDYETYAPAIPAFDGYHPYQPIIFQYSLHIQREPGGQLEHKEFLAESYTDPIKDLLKKLKEEIGPEGSVLVWYEPFEMTRNKEMAAMLPEYADFLADVNSRVFDLMKLFKPKRKIYLNSNFHESASIKKVLPVVCPHLSYDDLEIREGETAASSWPIVTGAVKTDMDLSKLRSDMLKYCERDTFAMVEILRHLENKTSVYGKN